MTDIRRGERRESVTDERGVTGPGETDNMIGRETDLPIRSREEMEERGADRALQDPKAPDRIRKERKSGI